MPPGTLGTLPPRFLQLQALAQNPAQGVSQKSSEHHQQSGRKNYPATNSLRKSVWAAIQTVLNVIYLGRVGVVLGKGHSACEPPAAQTAAEAQQLPQPLGTTGPQQSPRRRG